MNPAQEQLQQTFGFSEFRPGQEEVIGHLLEGRSAAAVFPTGSGKSLCYQLPALLLPGLTVVVSPLIALMKEQIDRLQGLGIAADRVDSTRTWEETIRIHDAMRAGTLRLLYVAPERFNNERFRERLQSTRVSLFAVDEAHCISEWGHNFRPDYLKLLDYSQLCGAERILALTATATPPVLDDICAGFLIEPECAIRTGFYRSNLTVRTTVTDETKRNTLLLQRLKERTRGPTIVYVTLQKTAEFVAAGLVKNGFPARAYHAGMKPELRVEVQDWFAGSDDAIVVATIAFGMGIDKANIRAVYHYNLPKSLENFSQEIGRAGRDGLPSDCEVLACGIDLNALENFVYGDTPTESAVVSFVKDVFSHGADFSLSQYDLANAHDIRQLVVRTLLTYLQLDGYLEEGTPYYSRYALRPITNSQQMLAMFDGERREFLAKVLGLAERAKTWFSLDTDKAAQVTGSPRERVVRALDYLAEKGHLELKTEGVRQRYHLLREPESLDDIAATLVQRSFDRETRELARLRQVVDLISHDGCQVSQLGAHFGEPLAEPCGHCSWCLGGQTPQPTVERSDATIDPEQWQQALDLRKQNPEVLGEPRAFARFVCGLSSPRLVRAKLTREPLFGVGERVPFATILEQCTGE